MSRTPIKVERKRAQRRTPEEIKRDEQNCEVCASKVAGAISRHWEEIRDREDINMQLEIRDNNVALRLTFTKAVVIEHEFLLDDGQTEMPLAEASQSTNGQ